MTFATLILNDSNWMIVAVSVTLLAIAVVWWAYRSARCSSMIRTFAIGLKLTGIALLAICLVDPLWSGVRARSGANLFLVLADNSRSLTIDGDIKAPSQGNLFHELLSDSDADWQTRLEQDFDVRRYLFDSRLQRLDDISSLDFTGNASSLRTSLDELRTRFRGRPVAGVLLLTDGNATDFTDDEWSTDGLPPVFPVVSSSQSRQPDVAIESVSVSRSTFEDAPVRLRTVITGRQLGDASIIVELLDESDRVVETKTTTIEAETESVSLRFDVRPSKPGVSFYRIRVRRKAADGNAKPESEATLANNERLVAVDRGAGSQRILYVAGRPNWEYKFLARAVADDDQIDLAALIRVARREPKFDWRSRVGESTNPLFRGFKKDGGEEAERHDEPVIVRLNMKDASELRSGFPKTEKELYRFKAVILDDVEAEFFTQDQMDLLRRFVSERGGGLLMLGGQESFHRGGYKRTPIADALPIYVESKRTNGDTSGYRLTLTRDGWLQPWIRLRPNEAEEKERLAAMPPFRVVNGGGSIKPGATVLAELTAADGSRHPALIAQRYGHGRTAALTIGDLWRWKLRATKDSDDQPKAWRQMLRWLVADVPTRSEIEVQPRPETSANAVALRVRARSEKHEPLDNAVVRVKVDLPDGKSLELDAEASLDEPGLYETIYVPRQPGAFRASAKIIDADGKNVGTAATGWVSDPAEREFRSITPNTKLLERLAIETGGELVNIDALDEFVAGLPSRNVPITEEWTYPLWHQSWVFLLAFSCFAGEWGLRRWKGLP